VAVRIRLKRMGKVRTPFYRIVVCDSRTKRDGRVIEEIGTYNPKAEPSVIHVDSERAQHWLGVGAQPSTPVAAILKLTGDWQKHKGESVTPTLKVAEPRRDKTEIFNEALKESHNEPKTEAVTKKAAKPEKGADKGTDKAADKGADKGTDPKADSKADEAQASASADDTEKAADESTGSGATADSGEQAKSED
jgi:small subunit ribosomal protein S16